MSFSRNSFLHADLNFLSANFATLERRLHGRLKTNEKRNARESENKRWNGGKRRRKKKKKLRLIKRRHIISVHMHEADRSIHPPVSQSKAIDERAQPGDRGWGMNQWGGRGERNWLNEKRKEASRVGCHRQSVVAWAERSPSSSEWWLIIGVELSFLSFIKNISDI